MRRRHARRDIPSLPQRRFREPDIAKSRMPCGFFAIR